MAKRVSVPEARSLFNKNVMLAPCVTRVFIVLFSLYILIVVVAFNSCLVIALQKSMKVLVSIKFQDYFTTLLYSVLGKSLFCR